MSFWLQFLGYLMIALAGVSVAAYKLWRPSGRHRRVGWKSLGAVVASGWQARIVRRTTLQEAAVAAAADRLVADQVRMIRQAQSMVTDLQDRLIGQIMLNEALRAQLSSLREQNRAMSARARRRRS